jgi:quinolinate synthase
MNAQSAITGSELHTKLSGLQDSYTPEICAEYAGIIEEILRLKVERRAVVLAHNYQRPEIFEVADFIGDSFELARKAREVEDADVIVFCGVHFMAETAKVFNPERTVLLPDLRAGCSLADSVTAEALAERKEELRALYPDLKVVSYVNCTADVKALSDACCTSANAVKVVNAIDSEHVLFVPDQNLANYVQGQTNKQIISWDGNCYVHHQITPEEVQKAKDGIPGLVVIAHPECRADVLSLADAVLSTSAMMRYAQESKAEKFLIVTECGLSDRLLMEIPDKHFYKVCKLCRYMKMITLPGVLDSLRNLRYEITLPIEVRDGAKRALERMLELGA